MNDKRTLTGALVRAIAGQFGAVSDAHRATVLRGRRACCRLVRAGRAPQWSRGPQTSHVSCLMSRRSRVGSPCLMSVFPLAPCRTSRVGGLMSHVPCRMAPRVPSPELVRSGDDRRPPQCTSRATSRNDEHRRTVLNRIGTSHDPCNQRSPAGGEADNGSPRATPHGQRTSERYSRSRTGNARRHIGRHAPRPLGPRWH